jgi:DNA-binding Lrp family transcriptional regulator
MVLAFSLIKAVPDREKVVYRALKELDGVRNLYQIFGDHDLLLILEAESRSQLRDILDNLEKIRFVIDVRTMLVAPTGRPEINACISRNGPSTATRGELCKCLH